MKAWILKPGELGMEALVTALKLCPSELVNHVMSNMSRNLQEQLNEINDSLPPMSVKEIEERQQQIINLAKLMADTGEIEMDI